MRCRGKTGPAWLTAGGCSQPGLWWPPSLLLLHTLKMCVWQVDPWLPPLVDTPIYSMLPFSYMASKYLALTDLFLCISKLLLVNEDHLSPSFSLGAVCGAEQRKPWPTHHYLPSLLIFPFHSKMCFSCCLCTWVFELWTFGMPYICIFIDWFF